MDIDFNSLKEILEANSKGQEVTNAKAKTIGNFLLKIYKNT